MVELLLKKWSVTLLARCYRSIYFVSYQLKAYWLLNGPDIHVTFCSCCGVHSDITNGTSFAFRIMLIQHY